MATALVTQSQTRTFARDEFSEFHELLVRIDEGTVRWPISAPKDLELDDKGHLKENGFALSSLAYSQLCSYVATGLWRLTMDVSGSARRKGAFDEVVSVPLAVSIFNKCVELRFRMPDGVCGRDMVQNHVTRVVDGIVGPRYRYLAHHQLLDAAVDMLASAEAPMRFHSGLLAGRRMSITFLSETPLAVLDTGEALVGGCYFTNSEAGECGVRGALMLQLQGTPFRCLMNMRHLAHAGKSFSKKLGHLLVGVMSRWDGLAAAAVAANDVLSAPLGLVSKPHKQRIVRRLSDYVDKALAADVVRRVVFTGADGTMCSRAPLREVATRTVRDVFITLMRVADGQYPEIRENLERAAFDVLSKRVQLAGK